MSKKDEYLSNFKTITEEMYQITVAKNKDYTGGEDDPFKNFKMVERLGVASTEQGFVTRMTDKLMRISTFVQKGILQVKDEKVEDTLLDLAVYCILMVCYLREKRNEPTITFTGTDSGTVLYGVSTGSHGKDPDLST